jgi:hypothetical protein
MQEIKFEPNVMCETIDKKLTFHYSQVCQYTSIQRDAQLKLKGHLLNCFQNLSIF